MWGRDSARSLMRSPGTDLCESVEFYLEGDLEMAIYQWHRERDCMIIVQVSSETEFSKSISYLWEMVLKWQDNLP